MTPELRPYQLAGVNAVRELTRRGVREVLLVAPTGCHAAGQGILLHSGKSRLVETIETDDLLMGPDSRPRQVLELRRGTGRLYQITPTKGTPFTVNEDHLLTLQRTGDKHRPGGETIDARVGDVLSWNRTNRHVWKLVRTGVEFQTQCLRLLKPYFVGLWLGDGTHRDGLVSISKPDPEVYAACAAVANEWGLRLRVERSGDKCPTYHIVKEQGVLENGLMAAMRMEGLFANPDRIPDRYKMSDRATRLDVLAGLLDSDGHLSRSGYDFISASPWLSDDVAFVARSLGLAAYMTACEKRDQNGQGGTYHRVSISGHTEEIPCRIPRKQAPARLQKKSVLRTGFTIESAGRGEYFGFTLDGDGRYLLDDFTVTHNSGKTICAGHILSCVAERQRHGLFLADRLELIDQASRKLDEFGLDHGVIMADHWRRRPHLPVQVASVPTLHRRDHRPPADLVLADEAHKSLSPSYRAILDHYRSTGATVIGLTATPFLYDGRGLGDFYREMVVVAQTHELIEQGYLVPIETFTPADPKHAGISLAELAGVSIRRGDYDQVELAAVIDKPALVGDIVKTWFRLALGRTTVVFCVSKKHARNVVEEFTAAGVSAGYLDDSTPIPERRAMQARIASGEVTVIVNVGVLALGWDMPRVSCVVMARPTLSKALYLQQVGRGSRPYPGKTSLIVLDHAGNCWRHGLPEEPQEFSLKTSPRRRALMDRVASLRQCPFPCGSMSPSTAKVCRRCGQPFPARERELVFRSGELVSADGTVAPKQTSTWATNVEPREMVRLLAKWIQIGRMKGYAPGYAFVVFKNSFGASPDPGLRSRAERVGFPRCLVPNAQCRHCGAEEMDVVPSPAPHAGQVLCRRCYRGLAWIPAEWASLVKEAS